MNKPTCILLTDNHEYLSGQAMSFASLLFDVKHWGIHARHEKQLSPLLEMMLRPRDGQHWDYLFNFLSPVILKAEQLENFGQAINFHPAPPRYPGVGSASLALYDQTDIFGVTAHIMTAKVDAGPIVGCEFFPIAPADTCETLFERARRHALNLFESILAYAAAIGNVSPMENVYWTRPAVTRAEFERFMRIEPTDPPEEIARKVRALKHSKFPGPRVKISGFEFQMPPETL